MTNNFGEGINCWVEKIKQINPNLGEALFEDSKYKEKNIERLEKLDLPYFRTKIYKIDLFLRDEEEILKSFRYKKYFVNLIHKNGDREREVDINKKNLDRWIKERREKIDLNRDKILISECPEQPYNGVLIVEDKDSFYLEMIKGKMPDLISKNNVPDFVVYKNSIEISTKYLEKNSVNYLELKKNELKNSIWELIKKTRFLAGYYEFSLVKTGKKNGLTPFFYEYIEKKEYRL